MSTHVQERKVMAARPPRVGDPIPGWVDESKSRRTTPVNEVQITISAGQAFKSGFYAFWGFLLAGIVPWIVLFILIVSLGLFGFHSASPSP